MQLLNCYLEKESGYVFPLKSENAGILRKVHRPLLAVFAETQNRIVMLFRETPSEVEQIYNQICVSGDIRNIYKPTIRAKRI